MAQTVKSSYLLGDYISVMNESIIEMLWKMDQTTEETAWRSLRRQFSTTLVLTEVRALPSRILGLLWGKQAGMCKGRFGTLLVEGWVMSWVAQEV